MTLVFKDSSHAAIFGKMFTGQNSSIVSIRFFEYNKVIERNSSPFFFLSNFKNLSRAPDLFGENWLADFTLQEHSKNIVSRQQIPRPKTLIEIFV